MDGLIARIRAWWETAEPSRKTWFVIGGSLVVIILISIAFWASAPDWTVLYSGLNPQDSGAIVDKLKSEKVPYKLSNNGATIEVPSKQRDDLRIALAKDNLPSGNSTLGYNRLDKMPFGATQQVQEHEMRVMMEEELQQTIARLEPVESARVVINPGSQSLFVGEDEKRASAMVVVHTKSGQTLTQQQTRAIALIVSRSVSGLSESQVAIVDGEGKPLWDGSQAQDSGVGMAGLKQDAEIRYSNDLQRKIQEHLNTVVGLGKSTVWVRAELDYDKVTETIDEPTAGAKASEAVSKVVMQKGTASAGGATGISGNTGVTYPSGSIGGNEGQYEATEKTTNVETGRRMKTIVSAQGKVKQLSVAVFVDESITEESASEIKEWLDTAVGATIPENTNRVVTLQRITFDKTIAEASAKAAATAAASRKTEQILQLLPMAALILVAIFVVKSLGKTSTASITRSEVRSAAAERAESSIQSAIQNMENQQSLASSSSAADAPPQEEDEAPIFVEDDSPDLGPIKVKKDKVLKQVVRFADEKPEQAALLVKGWINEDI